MIVNESGKTHPSTALKTAEELARWTKGAGRFGQAARRRVMIGERCGS